MKLKTLFLVREAPFPAAGGGAMRNWQNMQIMAQWGTVGVFSIFRKEQQPYAIPSVEVWQHSSNQVKRGEIARKFARRLYPLKPEYPYADGLYTRQCKVQIQRFLQAFQPDLIIVEEIWFYAYLPLLKQLGKPIVLDNHNIEAQLVKDLFKAARKSPNPCQLALQWFRSSRLLQIEKNFVHQVNLNWVCSVADQQTLTQLYQPAPTWVIPNGIDIADYQTVRTRQMPLPPGLTEPAPTVLFLGTLAYHPNSEAVEWLLTEIYPQLHRSRLDCRLLIVGRHPQPWMIEKARDNSNIIITGAVEDVRPYLAAAHVMVVPLLKGGGTRLKIVEAFAAGCPVVSTHKGAEGLEVKDGEHLLLRDSTAGIAAAVLQLWEQPALATALADKAWQLVDAKYSRAAISKSVSDSLQSLGIAASYRDIPAT